MGGPDLESTNELSEGTAEFTTKHELKLILTVVCERA